MTHWREIRKNGEVFTYTGEIWAAEEKLPRWWRNASKTWTPNYKDYYEFVAACQEAWGLFDDAGEITAVVYFEEQQRPDELLIHLSVVRKISPGEFVRKTQELRNIVLRRGVRSIRGWVLGRNRSLIGLLEAVGFLDTELRMDAGESHGRVLRWHLLEVKRG